MGVLAKYYAAQGVSEENARTALTEFLVEADPTAVPARWQRAIERHIASAKKYPLTVIESVDITEKELDAIATLGRHSHERVAFALVCAAKFCDLRNADNNGWANLSDKELFTLANVNAAQRDRALVVNSIKEKGLISYSSKVDNLNLRVEFIDRKGEGKVFIRDFRNLGYRYSLIRGRGSWMLCEDCGAVIRKTNNRRRFCEACARERDRRLALERWRRRERE